MPVSMCADSTITTALRNNLSSNCSNNDSDLHNKLAASAKHVLMNKIEFEEVNNYKSSFDQIKSKYIVLKAKSNFVKQQTPNDKEKTSNGNSGPSNGLKESGLPTPKQILFSRENVQIGWRSTSRKWHVGVGMTNVGNTCYLNSTLQALFHVPALANWLMSDSIHRENCEEIHGNQGGCIICAMGKTLMASQSNQQPIKPWLVYSKLRLVCKHLVPGRQEDAHEFLRYLIEAMEKAFLIRFKNSKEFDQLVKETTPLNQILGGYIKTAVRCLTCGHVSTTFQHFEDILLDIRKANTVEEALEGYFARERLEDMGYRCESCKKKVSATKQFCLERAPVVLCIQLKRFSMMGGKINKHVAIKQKLDLSAFSSKKSSPLTYKLVSMVTHLGSSQHCGHYTAVGVTDSGVYYQFDDSCVRSMSIQNALSTNAYIIFYELDDVNMSFDQNKILKETVISKTSTEVKARNDTITTGFTSLANFKLNTFNKTSVQSSPAPPQPINNKTSPDKTKIVNFPTNGFTIKEKTLINNSPVKNNEIKTICRNGNNLNNGKQLGSKLVIHFKDKKDSENSSDENKTFLSNGKNATNVLHKKAITSTNISENSEKKSTNKCSLPCMPTLIEEKSSQIVVTTPTKLPTTKVKSLVPYDDDSDDSTETVKTKVGIWEVTDDTMPSPVLNGRTNCSSNKFKQNGNKSENSNIQNGNGKVKSNQNGIKEDTVSQLLKLGHRGYGASVVSWNGESANITKEIIEEKREDRKRQKADDSENDIDRGRSKKIKSHKIDYGRDNPEFNPFQEHQTQQQNKKHFSHNGNNNKHYTGHIYRQSAHFKHFRGGRHRGGGFQNSNRQGHRNHFQYKNS